MKPQFTLTEKGLSINSFASPLSVFEEKKSNRLRARRIDALQRDTEVERQVRLHIVMRLIASRWRECLARQLCIGCCLIKCSSTG